MIRSLYSSRTNHTDAQKRIKPDRVLAKNPAPLVKVSHIVACNLPLSVVLFIAQEDAFLEPFCSLKTEDKSMLLEPEKKIRKLTHFKRLGLPL